MSNPSVCSILDMPDEILVKIILHFNARERLALGNSCQRFNDIVFGDKELLRNLDFTDEWRLTKESDIQKYFDDEITYKKILGINIEYVHGVENLSSSIGKAINLVELKIRNGLEFKSVEELSSFLKPLVHLKRLSVNWPSSCTGTDYDDPERNQVLQEPFRRLTYLLLDRMWYSDKFLLTLQPCQQLEKLSLFVLNERRYGSPLPQEFMKLSNLKSVQLRAPENPKLLKNDIMSIVPDPTEWTEFHPLDFLSEIYLERNVEVCAELEQVKKMPLPPYTAVSRVPGLIEKGWSLVPEHLLIEVIRVTHEDAPEKLCCLSWPEQHSPTGKPSLLKIDEAKKLLKDPEYQISSLCFSHPIEKNCDAHLLASAFPNLKRLVLYQIKNTYSMSAPGKTQALSRRLRKKGSMVSEEYSDAWNTDSSFKKLVENTPCLEVLVIDLGLGGLYVESWDLDALYLISAWKNLTVIRLDYVPITDGKFLIDIGRECRKLEEVTLRNLSPFKTCRYENELFEMLQHCKNLRKLEIMALQVERLSDMFNIISNRPKLVALRSSTVTKECDPRELTSSVEEMLRQCQELKRFSVYLWNYRFCDELRPNVDRVISKSNRPDFEFRVRG